MLSKTFKVTNENGIHARPATSLVNVAMKYKSEITLEAMKKKIDFKSIMGVMSLGIYSGVVITVSAEGVDEASAIEALTKALKDLGLAKEI